MVHSVGTVSGIIVIVKIIFVMNYNRISISAAMITTMITAMVIIIIMAINANNMVEYRAHKQANTHIEQQARFQPPQQWLMPEHSQ